ncbi:MAG: molecular chaperone Tir, partial [Proteobacteria bacterium]|nr:molecular chaperone Tir [Pseudomonadota bacterium]
IDVLLGLTRVDSIVFKLSCEKAIEIGYLYKPIDTERILEQASSLDIPQEEFFESLEILDRKRYIKAGRNAGVRGIPFFSITSYGFDKYARVYIDNYDSILKSVVSQILNHDKKDNSSISASLNQPQMIVDHFLEVLVRKKLIGVTKHLGGTRIWDVSPELRRML